MYSSCLICQKEGEYKTLNNLPMKKCPVCGLVWRAAFDLPENYYHDKLINLKSEKLKDRLDNSKQRFKLFKKYIDLSNLCDVGCGEGTFLKILEENGCKNLIGIEPSATENNFAELNKLIIKKGNLEDFSSLADTSIKTVAMFHLLEHLKNPFHSLKLIHNYLSQGGFLIIETPDFDSYSFKSTGYRHKLIYAEHLFYFNEKNLKKMLTKVGFKIIALGKRNFNQDNLSIKESLFRLGLIKKNNPSKNVSNSPATDQIAKSSSFSATAKQRLITFLKNIIRKTLSCLVVFSGRLDYLWVITQKN